MYDRWLHELWNGDLAKLEAIAAGVVTADFVGNWPGRPALVRGPDQLAAVVRQGREMFDELTFDVEVGPVVQGDLVAARWVAHGVYQGEPARFRGHDLLRHDGDRFTEYWVIAEDPTAGAPS
ncbi:SnoaL-like protein [Prauserella shujinwangii]|uniref:SnoaL-like protein n=1 Tax=Prauserella shujinwangii TaxID=1453103 RepID=A0A2T0LVI2_9PSEU|nr:nuclear transport factor 2 family protein [Prauserella shujinwangii]PRX47834.1 SnoaL-like protein [Prauserella shujinwangii]